MKKVFALAAFAALLLVGASKLNARAEEECIYGFITSCGRTFYVESDVPLSDDQRLDLLDALDDIFC